MDSWTSIFLCGEVQKPDRFPWINGICWAKTPTCFRTLFWSRFWHHSYAQCLFTNRGGWSWHHLTTWTRLQIGYVARAGELFGAGGFRNKRNLGRDIGLFFLEQFGYHGMGDQNQHEIHHISCILQIIFHERYQRHVTHFFLDRNRWKSIHVIHLQ